MDYKYLRNAHLVLLCFDLNDAASLQNMSQMAATCAQELEHACAIMIGCKKDLPCNISLYKMAHVKYSMSQQMHVASCIHTSAETDKLNVQKIIHYMNQMVDSLHTNWISTRGAPEHTAQYSKCAIS